MKSGISIFSSQDAIIANMAIDRDDSASILLIWPANALHERFGTFVSMETGLSGVIFTAESIIKAGLIFFESGSFIFEEELALSFLKADTLLFWIFIRTGGGNLAGGSVVLWDRLMGSWVENQTKSLKRTGYLITAASARQRERKTRTDIPFPDSNRPFRISPLEASSRIAAFDMVLVTLRWSRP